MQAAQLIADRLAEFYRPEIEASQAGLVQLLVSINDECHAWGVNPETNRSLGAAVATIAWLAPSRELLVFQAGDTLPLRFDGSRMIELAHRQGSGNCVDKYFGQGSGFNPVCTHSDFDEGDTLCLITDGVTKTMSNREIEQVLKDYPDPNRAANELVTRAFNLGSRDDITAMVIELDEW